MRREAHAANHGSSAASVAPSKLCARTTNSLPARTLPLPPSAIVRSVSVTNAAPCASMPFHVSSSKSSVNGRVTYPSRSSESTMPRCVSSSSGAWEANCFRALRFPRSRSWSS